MELSLTQHGMTLHSVQSGSIFPTALLVLTCSNHATLASEGRLASELPTRPTQPFGWDLVRWREERGCR